MKSNIELDRRTVLGTVGGLAVAGSGLAALTGSAAAGDTELEGPDETLTATTDDGEIKFVAYGGRLRFTWDGLDSEATHGEYTVETRVRKYGGDFGAWREHGTSSGELGANWGGDNDYTQDTGTDGVFQFKYGSPYGQNDYAIAYDAKSDLDGQHAVPNNYSTDVFEAATDGGKKSTQIEIRKTCRVYNGDPTDGGTLLVADSDSARMLVTVENRPATGETGGEIEGTIGADES